MKHTVEFTDFPTNSNWTSGIVTDPEGEVTHHFNAKLFDEGSVFGIDDGRVSKFTMNRENGDNFINYSRGWDVKPKKEDQKVFDQVIEFLENSPKRWEA